MDLSLVVEHIELSLTTGDTKKDQDTNYRARVFSSANELLAHRNWIGTNGGTAGEWFGSGCTYYPGPNLPNWCNTFDEWHASHAGDLTLGILRGARLEIEIGSVPSTDHWSLKAVVLAKVRGSQTLVALSPDPGGFTGIASDGHNHWPTTLLVPFALIEGVVVSGFKGDRADVVDRLERLAQLRDRGALNHDEFDAQKKRVLYAQNGS